MMLSIIVLVYNEGELLRRCIDSLLHQSKKCEYEILLIDDGSQDCSRDLCDEYAQNHSEVYVYHKKNGGCVHSRKFGIARAQGEYITFVDGDDFVETDYIAAILMAIEHQADYYILNNKRNFFMHDGFYIEKNFMGNGYIDLEQAYYWILNSMAGAVWDKVYVKSVLNEQNIIFDKFITYGEDVYINLQYLQGVKSVYVQDTAAYIHILNSPTSVCENDVPIKRLDEIKVLYDVGIDFMIKSGFQQFEDKFKFAIIGNYIKTIGLMMAQGMPEKAVRKYWLDGPFSRVLQDVSPQSVKEKIFFLILKKKNFLAAKWISKILHSSWYYLYKDSCYEKKDKKLKSRLRA
ncbi:Glycosyl transferase family 2 [Propionispira arboris]|uniref:Glycosyl transferase family 2 n=1 Tax=Propionispira arboris TaxID=84035 RepID=A0A1H6U806_9FIRM|nr:glycosyltransferase family 2 protein [Propionispira arboris]SEI84415.1 Glycosyl transferase family 2 [Propionispira arboris]